MGNEVATRSATELAQESAYDPFASAANDMAGSSAIYAKFNGNSGEFSYGAQSEEVEAGERMAANVVGARRGWICWKESEVVEEIMVPILEGRPPAEHTLTNHGPYEKHADGTEDGWSEQFSIAFRLLGEAHDGVEITYKSSTKSAMRPFGDLLKQFSREYKNNPGKVPIVEFGKGSYMPKEKKHGKKYFPTFKIVEWIDEDELLATYGDGSSVDEGDENDNLIEDNSVEEAAQAAAAAAAAKKEAAAKKKAEAAAKKAEEEAAAAAEAEAAGDEGDEGEGDEPAEEAAPEEDDEEAALLAQLEAARKKKAAAAAAASAADKAVETADKPAPAGRARRRSF